MDWDGRFVLTTERAMPEENAMTIGPLGEDGWSQCLRAAPWLRATKVPTAARLALPALRRGTALAAVPTLRFDARAPAGPADTPLRAVFRPRRPLCAAAFRVADPGGTGALAAAQSNIV